MYERYKPGLMVQVWRDIVWSAKQVIKARDDITAGLAFGVLFLLIPIVSAFMVG